MSILKATMRVAQVSRPGGPLELVERPIPDPGPGAVRIKVKACGVCHSDVFTKEGQWPGITFPRVPGHEVVGMIDVVGKDVAERWQPGQRVGVGWHAWHCFSCDNCRCGDFFACQAGAQVTGISFDGGYADYLVAPATALARVPAELPAPDAAPLMCAGVTTFNALRNSGARPGDLVAVLGLGGLGHLGVQYAARMGFRTAAIARGKDKEPLARQLGAAYYIDSEAADTAAELAKLGGAKVVLATVTHGPAMSATVGGLAPRGRLMVLGAAESLETFNAFLETYQAKYPKATECLAKDRDELLAFYDFPAEHWKHLRTTNPIESTFATIRLRHRRTKGNGSRRACLAMMFKLAQSAERRWRTLDGAKLLPDVIQGISFKDGTRTDQAAA